MTNRRSLIAAALALPFAPRLARAAADGTTLFGPPAAPSIVIAHAVASGLLADTLPGASFRVWKTPDEMRAGLSSGTMGAVIVPTYVAANLHSRGLGVRLANVMTDGLLYIVARPGTVGGIADLKGRRIAVPFRNDMPDFLLRRLLAAAGLTTAGVAIDYAATPPEAVQLLMAGRVDAALLSEPAVSSALARASAEGKALERAIDFQKAWSAHMGRATIPQAGLAVTDRWIDKAGMPRVAALQRALETALQAVLKDPAAAAAAAAPALAMPAPVIERSIPHSRLVVRPASAARDDLYALFDLLAQDDPRIIGGKRPDASFLAL